MVLAAARDWKAAASPPNGHPGVWSGTLAIPGCQISLAYRAAPKTCQAGAQSGVAHPRGIAGAGTRRRPRAELRSRAHADSEILHLGPRCLRIGDRREGRGWSSRMSWNWARAELGGPTAVPGSGPNPGNAKACRKPNPADTRGPGPAAEPGSAHRGAAEDGAAGAGPGGGGWGGPGGPGPGRLLNPPNSGALQIIW